MIGESDSSFNTNSAAAALLSGYNNAVTFVPQAAAAAVAIASSSTANVYNPSANYFTPTQITSNYQKYI